MTVATTRRRRRGLWLAGALVLLAVGAWIAGLGDLQKPLHGARVARVRPTSKSTRRERARLRVLPPAPPVKRAAVPKTPAPRHPARPSDPLLTALGATHGALVLEANALWNEPVGQMLLKCLEQRSPDVRETLDEARKKFHFDPIGQIDRMAVSPDHVVAFSGFFKGVDFDAMFPEMGRGPYGDHAVIYEPPPGAGPSEPYLAVWNGELLLFGQSEDQLKEAVDQLEGRAPRPAPPISPSDAYGDAYGQLPGDLIANMIRPGNAELADRISQLVSGARIHFDASGDVTLNASFQGQDGADLGGLERTMAGALAAARLAAQAQGNPHLADLLDDARVVPRGDGFALDVAVPESWVKQALGNCEIFGPPPGAAKPGGIDPVDEGTPKGP